MYAIRARRKSISAPWHALAMDIAALCTVATLFMSRHLDAEDLGINDDERAFIPFTSQLQIHVTLLNALKNHQES